MAEFGSDANAKLSQAEHACRRLGMYPNPGERRKELPMKQLMDFVESIFISIPFGVLEMWGRVGYIIGFALMVCAFGRITFRPAGRWGLGFERQTWDARALISMTLTSTLIIVCGYIGSAIVLVPGAQTFESLKDLSVAVCILLFGYPALVIVPIAYGISDLIEGVPPDFLLNWILGYFINPSCFWVAYQFIGRDPDFKKARTWWWYLGFVAIFMGIEPALWGYICSEKFTPEISYRSITPALFFTTALTWMLCPFAMLAALPLARRFGLFWPEIRGHVRERLMGSPIPVWESGNASNPKALPNPEQGVSIRVLLVAPFILLMLVMVATSAYVSFRSSEDAAGKLARRLHQEISENINILLDDYLEISQQKHEPLCPNCIDQLLRKLPIAEHGIAFAIDLSGKQIATSVDEAKLMHKRTPLGADIATSEVAKVAIDKLYQTLGRLDTLGTHAEFSFTILTAKPLSRETWLAQATNYSDRSGNVNWILVTAIPEAYYLGAIREGNSRSAMVFALALVLSLAVTTLVAAIVANPIRRAALATITLAGDLTQRMQDSPVEEINLLARSFNKMADYLQETFDNLTHEVDMRKKRELELDASERKVRESERRLQLAVRGGNLGIWDWDVVKDELIWDDAMYHLYGISPDQFGGAYAAWEKCLSAESFEQAKMDVAAALRGEREFASEFSVRWPDGSNHILKGLATTIRDDSGRAVRMVGINFDISEQKQTERELRHHRDNLEELVRERTESLSTAIGRAESANRAKSVFLANMSHELRTPLNAILGFSRLLERDSSMNDDSRRKLATINRSGIHLLALINEVLEISRIEAGRVVITRKPFDLSELLTSVEEMIRARTEVKGLAFLAEHSMSLPAVVNGDDHHLKQVLINLLGNAAKYTDQGSVKLQVSRDAGELIRFDVSDTGPGISIEDQKCVFQAFYQTEGGIRKGEGTGLGLAISAEYTKLMGGTLEVRSEPGRGSIFSVTIPLPECSVQATKHSAWPVIDLESGQDGAKVLVVDDSEDNLELARLLLESAGFEVRTAKNGRRALEMFQAWQPRLILMDMRMPVMDGYQATAQVRKLPGGDRVKVVALTASAFDEDRQLAMAAGCDEMVTKPIEEEQLFAVIGRLLGLRYRHSYAKIAESAADASLDLSVLALDMLADLRSAAEELDLGQVRKLLGQIHELNPALAKGLETLAQSYRFDRIAELCEATLGRHGGHA